MTQLKILVRQYFTYTLQDIKTTEKEDDIYWKFMDKSERSPTTEWSVKRDNHSQ